MRFSNKSNAGKPKHITKFIDFSDRFSIKYAIKFISIMDCHSLKEKISKNFGILVMRMT
jgi:hypothetical protein